MDPPQISAINVAEVLDVLVRHRAWPAEEVEEKLRWLTLGGLRVVAVDESFGLGAGRLHAEHYHRLERALSLADCTALATALGLGQRLATSDPALITAAQSEGCAVIALPDSRGHRPAVGERTARYG